MKLIENIKAINYNKNEYKEVSEKIIKDQTIEIKINNKNITKLHIINDSLEEFAIGYLYSENYISSLEGIESIDISNDTISILLNSTKNDENTKVESKLQVKSEELISRMNELTENAQYWKATGGTHVAGIVYNNQFLVKEDVSRHVAVDKVIGTALLNNFDLNNSYIVFSGRMPEDMVSKIVKSNIPILASNAAPTASGLQVANQGNITLVGFLRGKRFNVYNNQNRILF